MAWPVPLLFGIKFSGQLLGLFAHFLRSILCLASSLSRTFGRDFCIARFFPKQENELRVCVS